MEQEYSDTTFNLIFIWTRRLKARQFRQVARNNVEAKQEEMKKKKRKEKRRELHIHLSKRDGKKNDEDRFSINLPHCELLPERYPV